jgi:beta-galactosidase
MKSKIFVWPALLLASCIISNVAAGADEPPARIRETQNLDRDWRFFKGDPKGAEAVRFDDSEWRKLDVPHDWSIEGPYAETNKTGGAGGFLPAGVGWYRKYFTLPVSSDRQHVFIEFDGVMAKSDVWINGFRLGRRPSGYVSFGYDLTGHLTYGKKTNVLVVRADNSAQPASRWYSGAGIYRHVRLVVTAPTRIEPWGTFVTTSVASADEATVHVQNVVTNGDNVGRRVSLQIRLTDPAGKVIQTAETPGKMIARGTNGEFIQDFTVKIPQRWDPKQPQLYQAMVTVRYNDRSFDDDMVSFGIREFHFDQSTGFWLNGKNFKLYGVCLHHDGSAFGAAVPLDVWERRLQELKQLGVNAIRTAHNPPAPEFLDLCDRMGVLVMDEFFDCWTVGKNPFDYHLDFKEWSKIDARDTIKRDRNHPSIILYSVGNEIHDTPKAELAKGILKGLVEVCHENDPTRPVTQALFRPNVSGDYTNGLADLLDVIGTNYRDNELLAAQKDKPERKIIGTEQRHEVQTWLWLRDNASHSGQFLWSGVDYLGESRRWPIVAAGSGLLDRTGTPKPMAFQRQSWWSDKPMVYIVRRVAPVQTTSADPGFAPLDRRQVLFADWSPTDVQPEGENVEVFSNCEDVELLLNGKSLGVKKRPDDATPCTWTVVFKPGTLRAVGRNHGKVVVRQDLRTAGKPAKILLQADREKLAPLWDDVSYVSATIVDKNGVLIPGADNLITFKISGPGVIAAVDSADNSNHDSFQASERHAYQGRCFAILKSTASSGKIRLTAAAAGLSEATVMLKAVEAGE